MYCVTAMLKNGVSALQLAVSKECNPRQDAADEVHGKQEHAEALLEDAMLNLSSRMWCVAGGFA